MTTNMIRRARKRTAKQRRAIFARFAKMYRKGLKRTKVQSSNIHSVGYEPVHKVLEVRFKRKGKGKQSVYRYAGVESKTYQKMIKANSKGKFFYKNIRMKYPYERVT